MPSDLPPSIDPVAALRWAQRVQHDSPWLHEEVGRRMQERLQWIKQAPGSWVDWEPVRGGLQAHAAITRRYPQARCHVVEALAANAQRVRETLLAPWWRRLPWSQVTPHFGPPGDGAVQMVWANMALHMSADPQALIALWHRWLAVDGFLMFSCLGPDSLRELRDACRAHGLSAPAHEFTDMHDWGDMLVHSGFAEPVMDMERITLTFDSPLRALRELRELGRNLNISRFPALRGRGWHTQLEQLMLAHGPGEVALPRRVAMTFEIIYGHAIKPARRLTVKGETVLSLEEMRRVLTKGVAGPDNQP